MAGLRYAELHCWSNFTFLEGGSHPEEIVDRAVELELSAVALTDRDGLYGAVRFAKHAKTTKLGSICGAELTLQEGDRVGLRRPSAENVAAFSARFPRLVLLAEDETGYANLVQLVSIAQMRGRKRDAQLRLPDLDGKTAGLVALSSSHHGYAEEALLRADAAEARERAATLRDLFGARFYLELQHHLRPEDARLIHAQLALAAELDLPCVATNGVVYGSAGDALLADAIACVKYKTNLASAGTLLRPNHEFFLKDARQMARLFASHPQALRNTLAIAERCTFRLVKLAGQFPHFPIPPNESSTHSHLRTLVFEGARKRYGDPLPSNVERQLEYELGIIARMDLAGYFLVVWDISHEAEKQRVLAQGRGSAANSAVCYALGITAVDPVGMNLLFERFLSEERNEVPDIDIDFAHQDREKIIQYVYNRYGREHAAMTAEVITYRTRSAIRDVGKALGLSIAQVDALAKEYDAGESLAGAVGVAEGEAREDALPTSIRKRRDLDAGSNQRLSRALAGDQPAVTPGRPYAPNFQTPDPPRAPVTTLPNPKRLHEYLSNQTERKAPATQSEIDATPTSTERSEVVGTAVLAERISDDERSHGSRPGWEHAGRCTMQHQACWRERGAEKQRNSHDANFVAVRGGNAAVPATGSHRANAISSTNNNVGALLLALCRRIDGFPRHMGIHSGGMVITRDPLVRVAPVEWATMRDRTIVQWDKDDLSDLGLIKIDLLGLGMLSLLRDAFALFRRSYGDAKPVLSLATIPPDDPATYAMLQKADSIGVFQVESRAQQSMLPRMKPKCFYDIVMQVAIIRPGPIQGDMIHPFLRRRNCLEPVTYPHPKLKPILERTLGVPLFQEQGMRMAIETAGFSPGQADQLRRAMGHKRSRDRMAEIYPKLVEGMVHSGIEREAADKLFHMLEGFADYGFPESHAASFALLAYASAYVKCHEPAIFLAAILNVQPMGFYSTEVLVNDARRHGVAVKPVEVNASEYWSFVDEEGATRLGFHLVRGLGEQQRARLEAAIGQGTFEDLLDFSRRTGLAKDAIENLAVAGAFAPWFPTRREAMWALRGLDERETRGELGRAMEIDDEPEPKFKALLPIEETTYDIWSLGLSTTTQPIAHFRDELTARGVLSAERLETLPHRCICKVGGMVITRQRPGTAKGFVFLTLEDETGLVNVIVRPDVYDRNRRAIRQSVALIIEGTLQKEQGCIDVLAKRFWPLDTQSTTRGVHARNFH